MGEIAHQVSGFVEEMEFLGTAFDGARFGTIGPVGHLVSGYDFDHASTKSGELTGR